MSNNKNVMFFVFDPLGDRVVLYEKTWQMHISEKHNPLYGEELPDLGDIRESVLNPDQLRRSLHPEIGNETCLFEKFIGPENLLLRTPVFYPLAPNATYEHGAASGRVTSSFIQTRDTKVGMLARFSGLNQKRRANKNDV